MDYVKGFRFRPTDAEAIEILWDKINLERDSIVQVGDSLVRVITQLKDICKFEPEKLPGRSELESGDNIWYFFCSPRYKYRNSKRKNRVTKNGYWKPTGNPSEIATIHNGKKITGTRQTLVFYKGRVSDKKKNENRTPWVMHEFELTVNLPNYQESLTLCKLKRKYGKVDVSRGEEGQSSHLPPSNLENHCTNNAAPEDQLNYNEQLVEPEAFTEYSGIQSQFTTDNDAAAAADDDKDDDDDFELADSLLIDNDEPLIEPEAFTEYSGIQSQFTTDNDAAAAADDDKDDDDDFEFADSLLIDNDESYSNNQHRFVDEDEVPKLSSNFQMHAADNDIPKNQEGFCELMNQKPKAPNECIGTLNEVRTSEHGYSSWSSIFMASDQTISKAGSSLLAGNEGSGFALENKVAVDSIPPEYPELDVFLRNGIFVDELLQMPEAPKNPDGNGFWNSIFFTTDEIEDYAQDPSSKQQNLAADNEDFNSSTRKRPRVESERLTSEANIEVGSCSGKETLF